MIIGLVGDICSGKSTVADEFRKLGAVTFDADKIAKSFLEKIYVKKKLYKLFGRQIFIQRKSNKFINLRHSHPDLKDLDVDRKKLADIVFSNIELKRKLEKIIHPLVCKKMTIFLKTNKNKIMVLDVPLLVENKMFSLCDKIIFVKTDRRTLVQRLKYRGITLSDYLKRRKMQEKMKIKLKLSNYIIYNTRSLKYLKLQCKKLFEKLEEEHNEEKNKW